MEKQSFVCLPVSYKAEALRFIEIINYTSVGFITSPLCMFWYPDLNLFSVEDFLLFLIRGCRRNVSIFINLIHHIVQGFSLAGVGFPFFHLYGVKG